MANKETKTQDEPEFIPSDSVDAELEQDEEDEYERGDRRRGGAFDTLARILRGVIEIGFSNNFVIRNRPGKDIGTPVKAANVFEAFQLKRAASGVSAMVFGREGTGRFRNINLISFAVDHISSLTNTFGYTNGVFRISFSKDGADNENRTGLFMFDRRAENIETSDGPLDHGECFAFVASKDGEIRLSWTENALGHPRADTKYDLFVSKHGIRFFGIPTGTSAPSGLPSGYIWRNTSDNTIRIVP